jgi:hypothetical protein
VASFQNVYREAFGLTGDILFCLFATTWLSRYIFMRWLVFDKSTNSNPTIRGVLAHWISSHVVAGQYFDRPSSQVLAKQGIAAFRAEDDGRSASLSTFILPSALYTWQFFRIWVWFPLLNFYEKNISGKKQYQYSKNNSREAGSTHTNPKRRGQRDQRIPQSLNKLILLWNKFCNAVGPTLQMAVPLLPAVYYTWTLAPLTDPFFPSSSSKSGDTGADVESGAYGAYRNMQSPAWSDVLFYMSVTFMLSVMYYSRLILPIPDLVAGGNVMKAVRNEAKTLGGTGVSAISTCHGAT